MMAVSVEEAQRTSAFARKRLLGTAGEIKSRLAPSHMLEEAKSQIQTRSTIIAHTAGETVRERPLAIGAAIVAGMIVGAHRPLFRFGRNLLARIRK